MTSTLSTESVKTLGQNNCSRHVASKRIIPAIPLSYVRMRQQIQAKRAKELSRIDKTVQVVIKESEEQGDREINFSQSNVDSIKPKGLNGIRKNDVTPSSTDSASRQENVEIIAEPSPSTESSNKSSKDIQACFVDAGACNGQPICSEQEQSQGDKLSSSFMLAKQSQGESVSFEAVRFPNRQSFGISDAALNEKTIVCDKSDSSKSSPAPPQSAAHLPSSFNYEQSLPGNCLTHQSHSGFPQNLPNAPPPVNQLPPHGYYLCSNGYENQTLTDQFGRGKIPSVRSCQEISPAVTHFEAHHTCDPITPQSFQGSHSSAQDRDISKHFNSQDSPVINTNRFNGNLAYTNNYPISYSINMNRDHYPPPLPILQNHVPQLDMFDGLIEYLSSQFANPAFADYILELRYSDDRAAPVRIPGHNLMFARSITLRNMMLAARNETEGASSKTLLIESDDRFLCTDGLYMAMHRLYGNSLLDLGAIIPIGPMGQYQLPLISTSSERFDLAIGYAAAGHLLKMNVVVNRGCEIASLALNWINLERGLDFALDGGLEPQWRIHGWDSENLRATYGPGVNMIIIKAIGFICHQIPAHFQLDTSVSDARFVLRLPKLPGLRKPCLNSRLSHIRFGDHTVENFQQLETQEIYTVVLSRVLISLPWELLRYIFESPHLARNIESLTLRHKILSSVVHEREKRRLQVYNSPIPNFERQKNSQEWIVVGWKEEVETLRGGEMHPKLIRSWVDFRAPES